MTEPNWLPFTVHQPKRKRAELVCTICHSKKVKCDLQARTTQGFIDCSNCASTERECRVRPSKRDKKRNGSEPRALPNIGDSNHNLAYPRQSSNASVEHQRTDPSPRSNHIPVHDPSYYNAGLNIGLVRHHSLTNGPLGNSAVQRPATHSPVVSSHHNHTPNTSIDGQQIRSEPAQTSSLFVDTLMGVYGPEHQTDAENQALEMKSRGLLELPQPHLQQIFIETYFDYCYTWCPVLERSDMATDLMRRPILANAIALVGSHVQPPMIPHAGPAAYYDRARRIFYEDEEPDVMTQLRALSLFYWWSPRPPSIVHKHSSWWWTAVVIRHAQQMGVNRAQFSKPGVDVSLARKIWWTAFARERLTALCQGRPSLIDPDDCSIAELTLDEFENKERAEVFIYWVRLCAIIGKVAKHLSRSHTLSSTPFPVSIAHELIGWVRSLPPHLQLPIQAEYTTNFNRDVFQMHLPYLTLVTLLHLRRSEPIPQAYAPAMLAATCVARIFKDILARGGTRFLMAISCWYCGTAFIALLQAFKTPELKADAEEDLDILMLAMKQLKVMWPTGNIFDHGFERLKKDSTQEPPPMPSPINNDNGIDWMDYFPFVTAQTSNIASKLLEERTEFLFDFPEPTMLPLQDFFGPYSNFDDLNIFM